MNALIHGFRHYVDFSGRDSRRQFWGFFLLTRLISLLLLLPIVIASCHILADVFHMLQAQNFHPHAASADSEQVTSYALDAFGSLLQHSAVVIIFCLLLSLWWLAILVPTIAATVRRLRDAGQSPWWILPPAFTFTPLQQLIPALGAWPALLCLITLVLCCQPTANKQNLEQEREATSAP